MELDKCVSSQITSRMWTSEDQTHAWATLTWQNYRQFSLIRQKFPTLVSISRINYCHLLWGNGMEFRDNKRLECFYVVTAAEGQSVGGGGIITFQITAQNMEEWTGQHINTCGTSAQFEVDLDAGKIMGQTEIEKSIDQCRKVLISDSLSSERG